MAHDRNLRMVLDDVEAWKAAIQTELDKPKFKRSTGPRNLPHPVVHEDLDDWMASWVQSGLPAIRIHDAGDFFAEWYLDAWTQIAESNPALLFYCYTKEVSLFRRASHGFPQNFRFLFSTGGLEDALIGDERHADVFPTQDAMDSAGYRSQDANDLLAVMLPTNRIGITANNIKHFNKKMAGRTFGQIAKDTANR